MPAGTTPAEAPHGADGAGGCCVVVVVIAEEESKRARFSTCASPWVVPVVPVVPVGTAG